MTPEKIIDELRSYEATLSGILSRFQHSSSGLHISRDDHAAFEQLVLELRDFFNDALGRNSYSPQIVATFNEGISNFTGSPSYRSVESAIAIVRAAIKRFSRNMELLVRKEAEENLRKRENVFIIHGRDEAKWRELKDIVKSEFRLNPIVLLEQPDAGCRTVIEKFEHYAQICSYAIAIFTPDDEIANGGEKYLQARPNVVYELGWFCGKLDRKGAMLLLKEGTSVFSDFGGIIQKRFKTNVAEKLVEIRKDLIAAGILDDA